MKIDQPQTLYRTVDLCAGIGGIRRGFELTGVFQNVLSAEIDKLACSTYKGLFGDDPYADLTSEEFKQCVDSTPYDVLLAGFPCQTFSRAGLGEGFENEEKGKIFFHIAEIIKRTRPSAIFLENVDHLVTRDHGKTFRVLLRTLETELNYKVIGALIDTHGAMKYEPQDFIRNSRHFGVPQNRPRTYIIGFDRERFETSRLDSLPPQLPQCREEAIYRNLYEVMDKDVPPKYYIASGYMDTLKCHRQREESKGHGFGYRIVNEPGNENPIANALLATGGSGRERNLLYDPRDDIAGMMLKGKKTPLNHEGIRAMTPLEWGKLQGFIDYAFVDDNGIDQFSFPTKVSDVQRYKQFGNSVTIPAIEVMARFVADCLRSLSSDDE